MSEIFAVFGFLIFSLQDHNPDILKKDENQNYIKQNVNSDNLIYNEKSFKMSWKIKNNSITNIPIDIKKQLKEICKNHNRTALIEIKSFANDTVVGTFDCRL